jgi:hypothetical protein
MHRLDFPDALPMQDEDIASFRDSVGRFLDKYATPEVIDGFRKAASFRAISGSRRAVRACWVSARQKPMAAPGRLPP